MPSQAERHDLVHELAAAHARGLPEAGKGAHGSHAGDRVDLVDEDGTRRALDEEVAARVSGAVDSRERAHSEATDLLCGRRVENGWDRERHHPVGVLRLVVVELVGRHDLSGYRGARRLVAEHAALELASLDRGLDDDLAVVTRGELQRRAELAAVVRLGHPDARAEVAGLDEHGVVEAPFDGCHALRAGATVIAKDEVLRLGQTGGREHRLHELLVHADGAGDDAGPRVRETGALEEALDRPVLAERAVQDRKGDVQCEELTADTKAGTGRVDGEVDLVTRCSLEPLAQRRPKVAWTQPAPLARQADGYDLVLRGIERAGDEARRGEGDLVLGGTTAEDQRQTQHRGQA